MKILNHDLVEISAYIHQILSKYFNKKNKDLDTLTKTFLPGGSAKNTLPI